MERPCLADILAIELPPAFSLVWHRPGFEAHWLSIQRAADLHNAITKELFAVTFGLNAELHEARIAYVLDDLHAVVGTAAGWFGEEPYDRTWGRVHWLAVRPRFQGRGLGAFLLSAVCRRMLGLSHTRAYLTTSAIRMGAIRLYERAGFEPVVRTATEEEEWRRVRERMERRAK